MYGFSTSHCIRVASCCRAELEMYPVDWALASLKKLLTSYFLQHPSPACTWCLELGLPLWLGLVCMCREPGGQQTMYVRGHMQVPNPEPFGSTLCEEEMLGSCFLSEDEQDIRPVQVGNQPGLDCAHNPWARALLLKPSHLCVFRGHTNFLRPWTSAGPLCWFPEAPSAGLPSVPHLPAEHSSAGP